MGQEATNPKWKNLLNEIDSLLKDLRFQLELENSSKSIEEITNEYVQGRISQEYGTKSDKE